MVKHDCTSFPLFYQGSIHVDSIPITISTITGAQLLRFKYCFHLYNLNPIGVNSSPIKLILNQNINHPFYCISFPFSL